MLSKRKFYLSTFHLEVMSESPLELPDLDTLAYEISEGECSGVLTQFDTKELDGLATAAKLREQGSDPGFFSLTDDGEDMTDDGGLVIMLGQPEVEDINRWMLIAQDVKKSFTYDKSTGAWYWHDRDGAETLNGPFASFVAALADAIDPYLDTEDHY